MRQQNVVGQNHRKRKKCDHRTQAQRRFNDYLARLFILRFVRAHWILFL